MSLNGVAEGAGLAAFGEDAGPADGDGTGMTDGDEAGDGDGDGDCADARPAQTREKRAHANAAPQKEAFKEIS